jgi:hypothetical protein
MHAAPQGQSNKETSLPYGTGKTDVQQLLAGIEAICRQAGLLPLADIITAARTASLEVSGQARDRIRRHAESLHDLAVRLSRQGALTGDELSQLGGGAKLRQAAQELRRVLDEAHDLVRDEPGSRADAKAAESELS